MIEKTDLENQETKTLGAPGHGARGRDPLRSLSPAFHTDELDELADAMSVCTELDEFSRLLWKVTTSCGFQHFALSVLRPSPTSCFKKRICTSYRQSWIDRYAEMEYWKIDPAVKQAMSAEGSFLISDLSDESQEVRDFRKDAELHQSGANGIGFSQVAADGTRLGLNFITMRSKRAVKDLSEKYEADLRIFATLAMDCFRFVGQEQGGVFDRLSQDELRFLRALATEPDPSKALSITPSFGSNKSLQDSIRRKLGVTSIFQALYLASSRHWFDHIPIASTDVATTLTGLVGWELFEHEDNYLK